MGYSTSGELNDFVRMLIEADSYVGHTLGDVKNCPKRGLQCSCDGSCVNKKSLQEEKIFNDAMKDDVINSTSRAEKELISGIKELKGKLDYSEINFELLDLMAKRFMQNKNKYPKGNTLKIINKDEILWAAFRHIRKMIQPVEDDPETYEDHLAAVATNMSIILDQLRNNKSK
jgi:hypothetical protein